MIVSLKGPCWPVALLEETLQIRPCLRTRTLRQCFTSGSVGVPVPLDHRIVAIPGQLVGAVDPGEFSVGRVIRAHLTLVANPVWADDGFVCAEQAAPILHDQLGVEGEVNCFPARVPPSFLPPTPSSHGCEAMKKL